MSASWYVHEFLNNFLTEISFLKVLKTKDVRNNVRKWPNLRSIGLWNAWKTNSEVLNLSASIQGKLKSWKQIGRCFKHS